MYAIERIERSARRTIRRNDGANHNPRRSRMNRDRFEGAWKQLSGKVREEWCSLTDDAPGVAAARRDQRAGRMQERRGISKEAVENQLKEFRVRNRNWDLTDR